MSKQISRNEITIGKLTKDHARSVAGVGATEEEVDVKVSELQSLKKDVLHFARMELRGVMFRNGRKYGMEIESVSGDGKRLISKYNDIGMSWRQDGSLQNAERFFNTIYGWFDLHPDWSKVIEEKYMDQKQGGKLVYDRACTGLFADAGCIEKIVKTQRCDMIKLLNEKAKTTHGKRIIITRPATMINEKNRFKKRLKGAFYPRFVQENNVQQVNIIDVPQSSNPNSNNIPLCNQPSIVDMVTSPVRKGAARKTPTWSSKDLAENKAKFKCARKSISSAQTIQQSNQSISSTKTIQHSNQKKETKMRKENNELRLAMINMDQDSKNHRLAAERKERKEVIKRSLNNVNTKGKAAMEPPPPRRMSSLEMKRRANMKRNRERLKELGLLKKGELQSDNDSGVERDQVMSNNESDNDDTHESDDSDNDDPRGHSITGIKKERKSRDSKIELLVMWDNDYESWEYECNVIMDEPELVAEFKRNKMKRDMETKCDGEKGTNYPPLINKTCNNDHALITNYKSEDIPTYWNVGEAMHDILCRKCQGNTRPTMRAPSYACVNWSDGCQECLCNSCYNKEIVG